MATADRVLAVLGLFTMETPEWTVEAVARKLGLSGSTAYGYVRSLAVAGLLVACRSGRYTVGPAVISLDRVTRRHDVLVSAARASMHRLVEATDGEGVALLCRSFRLQVLCVDQQGSRELPHAISYERGRPMPLYRGAASKAILAHLPSRTLRRLWDTETREIEAAGLGQDWEGFKRALRVLRKPAAVSPRRELDPGLVRVSAPVFDASGVLGSVGVVLAQGFIETGPKTLERVTTEVGACAAAVSQALEL